MQYAVRKYTYYIPPYFRGIYLLLCKIEQKIQKNMPILTNRHITKTN